MDAALVGLEHEESSASAAVSEDAVDDDVEEVRGTTKGYGHRW